MQPADPVDRPSVNFHEFVVMPDHFHLIISPAEQIPLEKAVQYIPGLFIADPQISFSPRIP